jgi:hypothetical protein
MVGLSEHSISKNYNITFFILFIVITIAVLPGCQKEIDVKQVPGGEGQLFIECILYPDERPRAFISKSMPYFAGEVTPQELFARGVSVSIYNDSEADVLKADSTFDRFRCRWIPFYGGEIPIEYGRSYELVVDYEDQTYRAATTIDQQAVKLDSVIYTPEFFDIYGGHDGVILYLTDSPGQDNYYRFQMNRMIDNTRLHAHELSGYISDCTEGKKFLSVDLGRTIFSDENVDGQAMELYVEVSFEYLAGDSAWIYVQSLDKNSADFFSDLDLQLQSIKNPFVENVFLKSRIEGAIGVFGSVVRSDPVLFIYPQDNP